MESQPQNPELGRFLWLLRFNFSLSKKIDHLNLKFLIFIGILQVLRFDFQKFRFWEILNFPPDPVLVTTRGKATKSCFFVDLSEQSDLGSK